MKRQPFIIDPAIKATGMRRPGINHIGRRWLLRAPDGTRELGSRTEPGDAGWFRIRNEMPEENARVDLYDEIGWDVTAGDFVRELNTINAPGIDLYINSPGGSAWDGFAIYNALVMHPAPVTAYVVGVAASAASIIAMAGDEIVMCRPSQMMIHRAGSGACVFGNADDMRAGAAEVLTLGTSLDQVDNQIVDLYAAQAGTDPQIWHDYVWAETWFDPDTALGAGLINRIYGDDEVSPAAGAPAATDIVDRSHRDRRSQTIRARARQLNERHAHAKQ